MTRIASLPPVVTALFVACVLPELWISLSAHPGFIRAWLFNDFAFWPGLLRARPPVFPGQGWVMFLSYGFVHAGLVHLAFNMMTLWSLGRPLEEGLGWRRFSLLYAGSQLGGGLAYALLTARSAPMVGASGALFGLAGAILWVRLSERVREMSLAGALRDIAKPVALLIGMNFVLYLGMNGSLAWQAHLGGFLTGAVLMAVLWQRPEN